MRFVGKLLKFTAKEGAEVVERRLQAAGGSLPIWLILQSLSEHEGELQRQLAQRLCIEGPTMTRHLDNLEADGLIERRPAPADRRGTLVYATDQGRARLRTLWAVMQQSEDDLLAGFAPDDVDALEELLTRLRENVWRAARADAQSAGRPAPPHPMWMEQRHVATALSQET